MTCNNNEKNIEPSAWRDLLELKEKQTGAGKQPCSFEGLARILAEFALGLKNDCLITGHLGQTVDGFIADAEGQSKGLSSQENIIHLHRYRALSDAIIVGASTIFHDNPRLTTRLVEGLSPARIVLDPFARLEKHQFQIFNSPDEALTLRFIANEAKSAFVDEQTVVLEPYNCEHLRKWLLTNGYKRVFVEGGGKTVSSFFNDRQLDRLQICISPKLIGRRGIRGIDVRDICSLEQPVTNQASWYPMGCDMLFDSGPLRR